MSSSNCCFLTCIQISQEAGKVVGYSHLLKNFPQFVVIHTVKGFGVVNKAEVNVILELSLFIWSNRCCNLISLLIMLLFWIFSLLSDISSNVTFSVRPSLTNLFKPWPLPQHCQYPFVVVQSLNRVWVFAAHQLQPVRLPCPSPSPGACSNSCPLSQWCHPTITSSVIPFSSCLQSCPASRSFLMSWLFESGGQSIGASASTSVHPYEYSGLISFRIDWFDLLAVQGILKSLLPTLQLLSLTLLHFFSSTYQLLPYLLCFTTSCLPLPAWMSVPWVEACLAVWFLAISQVPGQGCVQHLVGAQQTFVKWMMNEQLFSWWSIVI